jgi:uncharacterized protein
MIYIAFLIFTLAIFAFAFYQWQYFMVFSPTYYRDEELGEGYSALKATTDDGVELEGALFEPINATKTLLVFVGRSQDAVGLIDKLSKSYPKTRVVVFNYRSYGKSGGVANEKNLLSDGLEIAERVQKEYGFFYVLGFSIGSSVAAYVASKRSVKGVFLVGAFDSIASLATSKFENWRFGWSVDFSNASRYGFNTFDYVKGIDSDVYMFVSESDETACLRNARNVKTSVKNLAYYRELQNLTHKELLWDDEVVNKINEVVK